MSNLPYVPDMGPQAPHLAHAYSILADHYAYRPDAVVLGKCYLCSDPAYIAARPYPDLMVAFGMVLSPR